MGRPSEVAPLLGLTRIGALNVVAGAVLVLGAELCLAGEVDQFGEAWLLTSLVTYAYDALDRVTGGGELGAPLALDVGVTVSATLLALALGAATLRRRTP